MKLSFTEENYLKALYKIMEGKEPKEAGTNELALHLNIKPSSVNDMLKKLHEKQLVHHERYKKIRLTEQGEILAIDIIRKHRLWETFLHNSLHFSWDEVHELAEELEHIQSKKLIQRLDEFLGFPKQDPHGHPIPTEKGFSK